MGGVNFVAVCYSHGAGALFCEGSRVRRLLFGTQNSNSLVSVTNSLDDGSEKIDDLPPRT
jgi:hypothetical protein